MVTIHIEQTGCCGFKNGASTLFMRRFLSKQARAIKNLSGIIGKLCLIVFVCFANPPSPVNVTNYKYIYLWWPKYVYDGTQYLHVHQQLIIPISQIYLPYHRWGSNRSFFVLNFIYVPGETSWSVAYSYGILITRSFQSYIYSTYI
jgi:hypothetical protein